MNFKDIMFSEISQTQKDRYCVMHMSPEGPSAAPPGLCPPSAGSLALSRGYAEPEGHASQAPEPPSPLPGRPATGPISPRSQNRAETPRQGQPGPGERPPRGHRCCRPGPRSGPAPHDPQLQGRGEPAGAPGPTLPRSLGGGGRSRDLPGAAAVPVAPRLTD